MLPQQYCLRWKYHHSNLQTMFSQLLDRGCFCDVTLACEGQTIRCHRVVLCACSTYFDALLTNVDSDKNPIIIMRDCKFADIQCLIEFMYKGEINVEHENLASLLKTAEELRIKGLAEVSWREDECNEADSSRMTTAMPHSSTPNLSELNMPMLTPIPLSNLTRDDHNNSNGMFPNKKKRGRPPLDEEYDSFSTPKISNIQHSYSDSSRLVSVMMDDNSKENAKDNMSSSLAGIDDNGPMNGRSSSSSSSQLAHDLSSIVPKIERPDTPLDADHERMDMDDALQSIFLTAEEREEWKDVIRMNDYLIKGRRPQFWEEPFTKRVMDAIKNKNLEMKKAAKLLGVSYGTLYGRYRETYGCLKGYRGPFTVQQTSNLNMPPLPGPRPWGAEILNATEGYIDASSNHSY